MAFMSIQNAQRLDFDQVRAEFGELPAVTRVAIVSLAAADMAAKAAALFDISRRPANRIRGPKWAWTAAQIINMIGPAAYWIIGRK